MEEFKIQEDFLQISELVKTENAFIDRSTPIFLTNRSLSENYLFDFLPNTLAELYEPFFTEYHGSPALLSEKISASQEIHEILFIYKQLKYWRDYYNFPEEMDFWILGSSYNNSLRIDPEDDQICGELSCYDQSLKTGKICKPGMFFSCIYIQNIHFIIFYLLYTLYFISRNQAKLYETGTRNFLIFKFMCS